MANYNVEDIQSDFVPRLYVTVRKCRLFVYFIIKTSMYMYTAVSFKGCLLYFSHFV